MYELMRYKIMKSAAIFIFVVSIVLCFFFFVFNNSETGARFKKDIKSDFSGGLERTVDVYDMNGNLIEHYEGKFDIEYDSEKIKFDDENGKRHIIYYKTGTIIVDEK